MGKVDVDVNKSLARRFNIQGYPTIEVFAADKNNPGFYYGDVSSV